jgi:hypothetical protein
MPTQSKEVCSETVNILTTPTIKAQLKAHAKATDSSVSKVVHNILAAKLSTGGDT